VVCENIESTSDLEWNWRPEVTWDFGVLVVNYSEEQAEYELFKN
jgi:hypothetical protein